MYACTAGNWFTAGAHIITAVIGSGVLSLAWAISTMGWAAGPLILFLFAFVTWYMSLLLADTYRNPRDTGKRNYTYPGAVSAILGGCWFSFLQVAHACVAWHTSNDSPAAFAHRRRHALPNKRQHLTSYLLCVNVICLAQKVPAEVDNPFQLHAGIYGLPAQINWFNYTSNAESSHTSVGPPQWCAQSPVLK